MKINFIELTRPSQKDYDPKEEISAEFNAEGQITLGRLASKNMIPLGHSAINPSGHGVLTQDGLYKDNSSNGTFVH